MPVYLSTATIGNPQNLVTLGQSGEIMAWFYPHKDHAQHIHQCLPCVYLGQPGIGSLHWTYGAEWVRHQEYIGDSNALRTTVEGLGLHLTFTDVMPEDSPVLVRQIEIENRSDETRRAGIYLFGEWNLGGFRQGNGVVFSRGSHILLQNHREAALAIGGDAMESWQCGKAGPEWGNNARYALENGHLWDQDLEIGDVNWAFGFVIELAPGETATKTTILALGRRTDDAIANYAKASEKSFAQHLGERQKLDQKWLEPGLAALKNAGANVPADLVAHYKRSLLCLPLLCGEEGVAVAAPEFDPEFISCGGYGYTWPRDGGEYVSGLLDAGYPEFCAQFFDWSAKYQAVDGLWHQRYFLNGEPAPNWCLPPDMLQIDQVGAVLWAYGKVLRNNPDFKVVKAHKEMIRKAADYLLERQDETSGVHKNAFDTWETFVGSFTYSNAAIYAAFLTAADVLKKKKYADAAKKMKAGVLKHFVRDAGDYKYLVRGFKADGSADEVVDSASLGAIEPFELLDLSIPEDLALAEGTLRAIIERLETDWEGGRAIRRFEGDAYVGGVPACVNTLWMARCCLHIAAKQRELGRVSDADELTQRAQGYLQTVLRRATPTGLLPELMQGPTGQKYWAAPHGWAMSSFVSGVLALARELKH